jgi:hypothetical protein
MKTFQKELGIQSNKLQPDVKERVEAAIAALGYRVTVGDVAARAGVSIAQADEALKALAYDSLGNLEVSQRPTVIQPWTVCVLVFAVTMLIWWGWRLLSKSLRVCLSEVPVGPLLAASLTPVSMPA